MEAIKCEKLVKKYKTVTALDGIDLSVNEGELFGLLGVNGAGKTTLIKILSTLIKPTEGTAVVNGMDVLTQSDGIRRAIDVSPQETSVALKLTVKENLYFFARIYCDDEVEVKRRVENAVEIFSLQDVINRPAKTLSGGWQRRLSIAVALLSEPKTLFLDEPTLGLDVIARRELWDVIKKLHGKMTIILTSHYLEEIEALCDRIAVMKKGKIMATGTVEEIKAQTGQTDFEEAFIALVKDAPQAAGGEV